MLGYVVVVSCVVVLCCFGWGCGGGGVVGGLGGWGGVAVVQLFLWGPEVPLEIFEKYIYIYMYILIFTSSISMCF